MVKKIMLTLIALHLAQVTGTDEKTAVLRQEVIDNTDVLNISSEKHPFLHSLIARMSQKAGVEMPRYVTLFSTNYAIVNKNGTVQRANQPISAYVDGFGDLYICRELLTDLSYKEIKGILAVALAEKAENRPGQTFAVGCGTFAFTGGALIIANKKYNLNLGSFILNDNRYHHDYRYQQNRSKALLTALLTPAIISSSILYNHLQKKVDLRAAQITKPQHIIAGIKGIERIQDSYFKEDVFSRLASALHLRSFFNTIFYPVRSYTPAERIAYLEEIADTKAL